MFRSFTIATLFLSCVLATGQQSLQSLLERIAKLEAQITSLEKQLDEAKSQLKEMAEVKAQAKFLQQQLDEIKEQIKAQASPVPVKPKTEPMYRSGDWANVTQAASCSKRNGHSCVVFQDKIWLIGGTDGAYKNDVWYSSNGKEWFYATSNAPWSARGYTHVLVYQNRLWIMGGRTP